MSVLATALVAVPVLAGVSTWTGSSASSLWSDAANWSPAAVPGSADAAIFPSDAYVTLGSSVTVSNLTLDAVVTFAATNASSPELRLGELSGAEPLRLANGLGLGSADRAITITNGIVISGASDVTNALTAHDGNDLVLAGPVSGSGALRLCAVGAAGGVHLAGDDSGFSGSVVIDGGDLNRMTFDSAAAGSSNAVWTILGSSANNAAFGFTGGTIRFGALFGAGKTFGGGSAVVEVGHLGTACASSINLQSTGKTLRKVGAGSLAFSGANYSGLDLAGGVFTPVYPSSFPASLLVFSGGTFLYPTGLTTDASALIRNSAAPITISDLDGRVRTFATALDSSNTGGLVKKGPGTLALSAIPAYAGSTVIEAGTLSVPPGTAFETLALSNSAALAFPSDASVFTNGATVTLCTYASRTGAALSSSNVFVSGLASRFAARLSFPPASIVASIVADTLVWSGASGSDWLAPSVWTGSASGASYSFLAGDAVAFTDSAFTNDASVAATCAVRVTSAVVPASVACSVTSPRAYFLSGTGTLGAASTRLSVSGTGSLRLACPAAFPGGVSVAAGELVIASRFSAPVENNALVRCASSAAATFTSLSGTGAAVIESGTATFAGPLSQPLTNSAAVVFSAAQELTSPIVGTGSVSVAANTALYLGSASVLDAFSGPVRLLGGASLSLPADDNPLGGASLRLFGGTVFGSASRVTNDVFLAGSASSWAGSAAAVTLSGGLSGSGSLAATAPGFTFAGDASSFAGSLSFAGDGSGFSGSASGSALAAYRVDSPSFTIDVASVSSPLRLGALDVTNPLVVVSCAQASTPLELGALGEACTLAGPFSGASFSLVKTGAAALTLGAAFACPDGSAIVVSNGTLVVDSTLPLAAPVTVLAGATLSGTGSLASASVASNAVLSGNLSITSLGLVPGAVLAVTPAATAPLSSSGPVALDGVLVRPSGLLSLSGEPAVLSAASFSGTPVLDPSWSDAALWRLVVAAGPEGTSVLRLHRRLGFIIIIR